MRGPGELGEFLRARRALLRPADVGLCPIGTRRRVPGLRREELAQLAGLSVSYYARLEQGQSRGASPAVLASLADALRLGPDEREHLRRLAQPRQRNQPGAPEPERVSPATAELIRTMHEVPVVLQGRRTDILAWNALGHALLAEHVDPTSPERAADRPNMARLVFLDRWTRRRYVDWPRKARAMVGTLRLAVGRHPADPELAALIEELSERSGEFAALWADHQIRQCDAADYLLRHPRAGTVTLTQQSLIVMAEPGQSLIVLTPVDAASRCALRRLVSVESPDRSEAAAAVR